MKALSIEMMRDGFICDKVDSLYALMYEVVGLKAENNDLKHVIKQSAAAFKTSIDQSRLILVSMNRTLEEAGYGA